MIPSKILPALALVLLACGLWFIYGRALDSPFIFDDSVSVNDNRSITSLWPVVGTAVHPGPLNPPKNITTSGWPLVNFSLALNYRFGQLNPAGYRAFNLMVHLLSACLLMAIVQRVLRLDYFGGKFTRASGPLALAVALLWAVHPLQTETVVYITQRTELLMGFFYLATLYSSLRYWAADSAAGRNTWLVLATLACLAGMACKEVMVSAPVVVLLFDRTFISGSFRRAWQKSWPLYVGLSLGWVLLLGLNYAAPRSGTAGFDLNVPAYVWWLTQTKVLLMYLKLAVWPWPLAIHYEMPYLTTLGAAWPWALPVVLLGAFTLGLLWRRNAAGFAGAGVFLILAPTLLVPIITEMAAERRIYLPLAALVTLVVVGGYALLRRAATAAAPDASRSSSSRWPLAIGIMAAISLALVFSLLSARRLAAYHDALTLWQDNVRNQPENSIAHNNLGSALASAGQTQEALDHFKEALRINPNYAEPHYNLGVACMKAGQHQEALQQFELAVQIQPDHVVAHYNLAGELVAANRLPEAIQHYQQAVRIKPDYAEAQFNLGLALLKTGRPQEAVDHCRQALEINPQHCMAAATLATAYAELNRSAEAIEAGQQALQLARSQANNTLSQQLDAWLKEYRATHTP